MEKMYNLVTRGHTGYYTMMKLVIENRINNIDKIRRKQWPIIYIV